MTSFTLFSRRNNIVLLVPSMTRFENKTGDRKLDKHFYCWSRYLYRTNRGIDTRRVTRGKERMHTHAHTQKREREMREIHTYITRLVLSLTNFAKH